MRPGIFLCLLLALSTCGSGARPFTKDMDAICNAPARSGATGDMSQRAAIAAKWISETIRTDEAKKLLSDIVVSAPEEKVKLLRAAATKAGVKNCPLAEDWENGLRAGPQQVREL